jgi:glycosyltransferase involved in cell wall biosynthesis
MKEVSVLIPTCRRPVFLRNALRSVQEQTAPASILEVVVVENGGQRESQRVCSEFPDLPIRYIFREPPLLPEHSGRDLFMKAKGERVAVLFDDDWWDRSHLEAALKAFERHPIASAYYCSAFQVASESGWLQEVMGSFIAWFACSTPLSDGLQILSLTDMVVASLFGTGFFYPCLVANSDHLRQCLGVYDYGNPYDTDRMLSVELAKHGPVIFDRTPAVFFRKHGDQEDQRLHREGKAQPWFDDSTRRILSFAEQVGIDVGTEFGKRVSSKGVPMRELIAKSQRTSIERLGRHGLLGREFQRGLHTEKVLRQWVPRGAVELAHSLRRRVFKYCG